MTLEKAENGKYVMQTINGMQGGKDAGRNWYLLLVMILEDFGFKVCPAEPALFVYYEQEDITQSLVVITSTDNFLVSYTSYDLFQSLSKHISAFVPITTQENKKVYKYLNCQIVQTDMGISFDQTHHIKTTIIEK